MFENNNQDSYKYLLTGCSKVGQTNNLVKIRETQFNIKTANLVEVDQLHLKITDGTNSKQARFDNCKQLEQTLLQSPELVQVILQLMGDAVIITDMSARIIFLNSVAEKLTGWRLQEAQSLLISVVFQIIDETNFDILYNPAEKVLRENKIITDISYALLNTRGNGSFLIEHSAAPIHRCDGQIVGAVLVFRDVSKSHNLARELSWQVSHDSLTNLMNRFAFEQYLEEAVSSAKALAQQHVLCYLDLDRFKIINDTCGHVAGNEFLRQVSAILQKRVRKTDVLSRLGSDEFGLILYQCNLEEALNVLHVLREEVQKFRFVWKGKVFNFSISIGVVILDFESENSSIMLNAADSACGAAKSKGRNRIQLYKKTDVDIANRREEVQWLQHIFNALEENQFFLYCQPIVPLSSNLHVGETSHRKCYEVLLRLKDKTGRIVLPGDFIPAAERYDLMHLIDRWVIQTLFNQLRKNDWNVENRIQQQDRNFLFNINLSGISLNDDQFLDFIQEQFILHSIPPQMICFEITETVAIANLDKAAQFIHQLQAIGCSFALDDFGSGMSSFGYLKSLPVNFLKIDGLFIKDILQSGVACEIVESINRIAHVMKIKTIAEYVESEEILTKLKTIGIDYAQGFIIAEPYPFVST